VAEAARRAGHAKTVYTPEKARVVDCLEQTLQPGDLLVTLGAGDVVKFGEEYLNRGRG
jgi:UDP-N-acetylmuramate--alanine ligase